MTYSIEDRDFEGTMLTIELVEDFNEMTLIINDGTKAVNFLVDDVKELLKSINILISAKEQRA